MSVKKNINVRLKVGLMAGVSLLLLAITILMVERFHFGDSGYPIRVSFQFVDAINLQADVVIGGGVKIGRVSEIAVVGDRIHLKLIIDQKVRIPYNAKFQILSKGLMGDKYINVIAQPDQKKFLQPGDLVAGMEPQNIDKAFQRFGEVADSISSLIGEPDIRTSLGAILLHWGQLSRRLDMLIQRNEKFIDDGVRDFSGAAASFKEIGRQVQSASQGLDEVLSADNKANATATLQNLKTLTDRIDAELAKIEKGQGSLGVLINDERLARDIQDLVKDVKKNPWKLLWKQ